VNTGVALVLISALFGLGVDACLQTEGQRKTELRNRADEILPSEARVLVMGYGDCVELAPSPSCSKVVFEMDAVDSAERAARMREEATGNGWTVTHSDDAQGGWSVFLKKDEFTAVVFLWRPEVYDVDCKGQPDPNSDANRFCFNTLNLRLRTGGGQNTSPALPQVTSNCADRRQPSTAPYSSSSGP
jgi:hypothetical protein